MILQNPIDEQGTTSESLWKQATNHERLITTELDAAKSRLCAAQRQSYTA